MALNPFFIVVGFIIVAVFSVLLSLSVLPSLVVINEKKWKGKQTYKPFGLHYNKSIIKSFNKIVTCDSVFFLPTKKKTFGPKQKKWSLQRNRADGHKWCHTKQYNMIWCHDTISYIFYIHMLTRNNWHWQLLPKQNWRKLPPNEPNNRKWADV